MEPIQHLKIVYIMIRNLSGVCVAHVMRGLYLVMAANMLVTAGRHSLRGFN